MIVPKNINRLAFIYFFVVMSYCLAAMPIFSEFLIIRYLGSLSLLMAYAYYASNRKLTFLIPESLLAIFFFWSLLTSLWSASPVLTILKSLSFALVFLSIFLISLDLSKVWPKFSDYLILFVVGVTGTAVILSFLVGSPWNLRGPPHLKGMFGISVTLGFMLFISFVSIIYGFYYVKSSKGRIIIGIFLVIFLAMLVANQARSGYVAIAASLAYLLIVSGNIRLILSVFVATILGALLVHQTMGFQVFYDQYVLKGGSEQAGVFASRQEPFEATLEGARQGSILGLGYGVSFGDQGGFELSATAVGYGREKGSSQLAVIEETGLIGLFIYFAFHISLFLTKRRGAPFWKFHAKKSILIGAFIHSAVEAWWVAPGSIQMCIFLALSGAFLGENRSVMKPLIARPLGRALLQPEASS